MFFLLKKSGALLPARKTQKQIFLTLFPETLSTAATAEMDTIHTMQSDDCW